MNANVARRARAQAPRRRARRERRQTSTKRGHPLGMMHSRVPRLLKTPARVDQADERGHEHRKVNMDRRAVLEHRKVGKDRARLRTFERMIGGVKESRHQEPRIARCTRPRHHELLSELDDSAPSTRHRKVQRREVSSDPDFGHRKMIGPPGYCTRADSLSRPDELGDPVPRR